MKKVLVISYYWPPSGGISVLRSLKIVKYLRSFGWEPVVYVPSNAHYPYVDVRNEKDIPEGIEIIRRPIVEPFKIFKILTGRKKSDSLNNIVTVRSRKASFIDRLGIWVRGNFFIPDARFMWIKPSVKYLKKYLRENPVDAIFTDGPPHTNTYIGYKLSKALSIPWLSDYQDPWTQVDYYKLLSIGKRADFKHRKMEQECFHQASKITIASPTWKEDLESIGASNVDVVYYGYDEDDFKDLKYKKDSEYFTICHIGLLGTDRNPEPLLKAIEKIDFNGQVKLQLAGQVDYSILSVLTGNDRIIVEHLGILPRNEALQLAMNADLLLLPLNKSENVRGRLPGKLYEYLRTYNPILALGPRDSDVATILKSTGSGECIPYEDIDVIANYLGLLINGNKPISINKETIAAFSNENQTRKIAQYLDAIV